MNNDKILVVIDMQKDFVTGSLGTKEAQAIVGKVAKRIREWDSVILATMDTHDFNYLQTQEGKNLPVEHCIEGEAGWEVCDEIMDVYDDNKPDATFLKNTFGSVDLARQITELYSMGFSEVMLIGVCTDICVISNAMTIKAFCPEIKITVDSSCCAGVTPESHNQALESMKICQVNVI